MAGASATKTIPGKAYLFRLKLRPREDKELISALHRGCTASRYAYNWCLALLEREYAESKVEARQREEEIEGATELREAAERAKDLARRMTADAAKLARKLKRAIAKAEGLASAGDQGVAAERAVRELEAQVAAATSVASAAKEEAQRTADAAKRLAPESVHERLARRWAHLPKPPKSTAGLVNRELNRHRDEDKPWQLQGVHSHTYGNAPKRVIEAQRRWFASGAQSKKGRPRFKRRGKHDSFTIQIDERCLDYRAIRIPGVGWVRVHSMDPLEVVKGKPGSVTVTRRANFWEASVSVTNVEIAAPAERRRHVVGIDLGVNAVATIAASDGSVRQVDPPRPLARSLSRLAELQRRFDLRTDVLRCDACGDRKPAPKRFRRGKQACELCGGHVRRWKSNRAMRLQMRIARLHYRVAQIRKNHLHQLSNALLSDRALGPDGSPRWVPSVIVVEGFNVADLVEHGVADRASGKRRRSSRRAILEMGWGELRRQIEYKSSWRGVDFLQMPKDFATDQTCHVCGAENKMPPHTSDYLCSSCGFSGSRQVNTAKLLLRYGEGNEFPGRPGRPGVTRQQEEGSTPPSPNERGSAETGTDRHAGRRGPNGSGDLGVNTGRHNETYPRGRKAPGGTRKKRSPRDPPGARNTGPEPPESPRA